MSRFKHSFRWLLHLPLFVALGSMVVATAQAAPVCDIIASEVRQGAAGVEKFTFYITASDSGAALANYTGTYDAQNVFHPTQAPLEYRARVQGGQLGAWRLWPYEAPFEAITIDVNCTFFHFEVRAKNVNGEYSPIQAKEFTAPFPITKLPKRPIFKTAGKLLDAGVTNRGLAVADLDQDGTLDLVDADFASGEVFLRRNTENDGQTFVTTEVGLPVNTIADLAVGPLSVAPAGSSATIYPDVVVSRNGTLHIIANGGVSTSGTSAGQIDYSFLYPALGSAYASYYMNHVAVGDATGDGKPDIVVGADVSGGGYVVLVLPGNGAGQFGAPIVLTMNGQVRDLTLGDINGDGAADIVAVCNEVSVNGSSVYSVPLAQVFLSDGAGGFQSPRFRAGSYAYDQFDNVVLADVNNDQKLDIVVSSKGTFTAGPKLFLSQAVEYMLNKGDDTFAIAEYVDMGAVSVANDFSVNSVRLNVAASDVNFDGNLDLVFGSNQSATGKIIHFEGLVSNSGVAVATRVQSVNSFSAPGKITALAIGDLDFNGQPDLVTATAIATAPVATLINLTPGGLVAPATFKLFVPGLARLTNGVTAGWDFNFSTVLAANVPGLRLQLQAMVGNGTWTDVPGAIFAKVGVNNWKLSLTDVPQGSVAFRVVATGRNFPAKISATVGPFTVNPPSYSVSLTTAPVTKVTNGVASLGVFKALTPLTVPQGEISTFAIRVTNNGSIGDFKVDAPVVGENPNFLALYATDAACQATVTVPVVSGSFTFTGLHKGETRTLYAKVRTGSTAELTEVYNLVLAASSVQDAARTGSGTVMVKAAAAPAGTFFVTNTDLTGDGSLIKALADARASTRSPHIKFEILPNGIVRIQTSRDPFGTALALSKDGTWLDGYSQRDYAEFYAQSFTTPAVQLVGNATDKFLHQQTPSDLDNGLYLNASNGIVEGIDFVDFYNAIVVLAPNINAKTPTGNTIRGCLFRRNHVAGVAILSGASTYIGGTEPGQRNYFQATELGLINVGEMGVKVHGVKSTKTKIVGNFVGLTLDGLSRSVSEGYTSCGILVAGGATATLIKDNVIGGNTGFFGSVDGIRISDAASTGNIIVGNKIGVGVDGLTPVPNGSGIAVSSTGNTIGGVKAGEGNVISANGSGISLGGAGNRVVGNFIGTDATGTVAIGNDIGVNVRSGSRDNVVGGTKPGERNYISGNYTLGVSVNGSPSSDPANNFPTTGTSILGNYIGISKNGTALPNGSDPGDTSASLGRVGGVVIDDASKSVVSNNIIAYNAGAGVRVLGASAVKNVIRVNSMYDNSDLGIDLVLNDQPNGVTWNDNSGPDGPDSDTGPNNGQNFPNITGASVNATGVKFTTVGVSFDSTPSTATNKKKFTVDFYASDVPGFAMNGEGKFYLGSALVQSNTFGDVDFSFKVQGDYRGKYISATATSMSGTTAEDTSEFGNAQLVVTAP